MSVNGDFGPSVIELVARLQTRLQAAEDRQTEILKSQQKERDDLYSALNDAVYYLRIYFHAYNTGEPVALQIMNEASRVLRDDKQRKEREMNEHYPEDKWRLHHIDGHKPVNYQYNKIIVCESGSDRVVAEWVPNEYAHLILMAPRLYKACRAALAMIESDCELNMAEPMYPELREQLWQAIKGTKLDD